MIKSLRPSQWMRSSSELLFYFGGDVQDSPEKMNASRENRRYQRWNLDATGEILSRRFPLSDIVIVRPEQMKDGIFSRFSNLLPKTNDYGDPLSYDVQNDTALRHLKTLSEEKFAPSSVRITLLGFSKGCVVLNQILHELTHRRETKANDDLSDFAGRIDRMIWLDGGHNNGKFVMIWPNERNLILTLREAHIRSEVYVTPFQIDPNNPHKRFHFEHFRIFSELLKSICPAELFNIQTFFAADSPSIEKHFELLEKF